MDSNQLLQAIEKLPPQKRLEVEDFVNFLASRSISRTGVSNDTNGLEELLAHPLGIQGFVPPNREEIYRRD